MQIKADFGFPGNSGRIEIVRPSMVDAIPDRATNAWIQLRWMLPLLAAILLACSLASGANAHSAWSPTQAGYDTTMPKALEARIASAISAIAPWDIVRSGNADCPFGADHANHLACTGSACPAVAEGPRWAVGYSSTHRAYEQFAVHIGDGRIIPPLFHPPKI
jgi:hypothetical protein